MQHAFFVLFCLKTEIFSLCLTYRPHVSGETLFFGYEKGDCDQKHSFSKSPSRVEILLKRRRIVYVWADEIKYHNVVHHTAQAL